MKDIIDNIIIKNRVFIYHFLLIVLVAGFWGIAKTPVYAAAQTLRVSPVIIDVSLLPGQTYNHQVSIENLTNSPLPLHATLNDFVTGSEDGGYVFEDTKTNPLLSWIKVSDTDFLLNPKEKKTIQMTITTPKRIPLGGYYGMLFFEPVLQKTPTSATQVNAKIGVLMLANVGVQDPKAKRAEIETFTTGQLHEDGTLPLLLRVKNISLNFFTAKSTLTVTPLFSWAQKATVLPLEDKIIFPGTIRRWTKDAIIQNLSPNIYRASIAVSSGNGQYVNQDNYFVVFQVKEAIAIILAIILLSLFILKRKQLKEAVNALIRP